MVGARTVPAVRETIAILAIALRTERRDIALSTFMPGSIAIRQLTIAGGYATGQAHEVQTVTTK